MSLEQKLARTYRKDAQIADMKGYGLSGGAAQSAYEKAILDSVSGSGSSGGAVRRTGRRKGIKKPTKKELAMLNSLGMQGEGLSAGSLSGGFPFMAALAAIPAIINGIKAIRGGDCGSSLSGGMHNPFTLDSDIYKRGYTGIPPMHSMGSGLSAGSLSGGYNLSAGYPSRYSGSFPMPGFSPPPEGTLPTTRGSGMSGGGKKKRTYQYSADKTPAQKAWQMKLKNYMSSHPGSSLGDAMRAMKGK